MPDTRVQSAIAYWAPRFVSNGVPLTDFQEVTAGLERWEDWCRAWSARAAIHEALGRKALADGCKLSAGEHLTRAAVCYHFSKFVFLARGMATLVFDGPGQGEGEYDFAIRGDYEVPDRRQGAQPRRHALAQGRRAEHHLPALCRRRQAGPDRAVAGERAARCGGIRPGGAAFHRRRQPRRQQPCLPVSFTVSRLDGAALGSSQTLKAKGERRKAKGKARSRTGRVEGRSRAPDPLIPALLPSGEGRLEPSLSPLGREGRSEGYGMRPPVTRGAAESMACISRRRN